MEFFKEHGHPPTNYSNRIAPTTVKLFVTLSAGFQINEYSNKIVVQNGYIVGQHIEFDAYYQTRPWHVYHQGTFSENMDEMTGSFQETGGAFLGSFWSRKDSAYS